MGRPPLPSLGGRAKTRSGDFYWQLMNDRQTFLVHRV